MFSSWDTPYGMYCIAYFHYPAALHLKCLVCTVQCRLPYKTVRTFISWMDNLTCQYLSTSTRHPPCHSNIPDHLHHKPPSVYISRLVTLLRLQPTQGTPFVPPLTTAPLVRSLRLSASICSRLRGLVGLPSMGIQCKLVCGWSRGLCK